MLGFELDLDDDQPAQDAFVDVDLGDSAVHIDTGPGLRDPSSLCVRPQFLGIIPADGHLHLGPGSMTAVRGVRSTDLDGDHRLMRGDPYPNLGLALLGQVSLSNPDA